MSKVLVTGANGFVGSHLVNELRGSNISVMRVCGPGKKTNEFPDSLSLDLTKPGEANRICFDDVSGVVHLAGLAAVGPSFDNPMRYVDVNVGIQVALYEAALKQGAKPRFLIVSSGTLYDPRAQLPLTEKSLVLPSSPYAVSKLGQEQMARYYNQRGIESMIVRPFNHVGPGQEAGFIVPDLAQQIVDHERGKSSDIMVGNLDAQRDYTDVRDIVRAYRLLLEKGVPGEIYNVCSGKALSGHDVLNGLLKAAGSNATPKRDPERIRPSDNPLVYGSHDKLTTATGWQPKIPIETTLADVIADWRAR